MAARLAVVTAELELLKAQKLKLQRQSEPAATAKERKTSSKTPWAFSPSGRWRPGMWSADRSAPISTAYGEPPKSMALADLLPLGTSSLGFSKGRAKSSPYG